MNRYCLNLKLGFMPTHDPRKHPIIGKATDGTMHVKIEPRDRDPIIVAFLISLGFSCTHSEIFYTGPNVTKGIHTDGPIIEDRTKINWVYGGTDSMMHWWECQGGISLKTSIGSSYLFYKESECRKVWSANLKFPSIIQAGVPHSVSNGPMGRWAVSYVLGDVRTGADIPWDVAVSRLSNFIEA